MDGGQTDRRTDGDREPDEGRRRGGRSPGDIDDSLGGLTADSTKRRIADDER